MLESQSWCHFCLLPAALNCLLAGLLLHPWELWAAAPGGLSLIETMGSPVTAPGLRAGHGQGAGTREGTRAGEGTWEGTRAQGLCRSLALERWLVPPPEALGTCRELPGWGCFVGAEGGGAGWVTRTGHGTAGVTCGLWWCWTLDHAAAPRAWLRPDPAEGCEQCPCAPLSPSPLCPLCPSFPFAPSCGAEDGSVPWRGAGREMC